MATPDDAGDRRWRPTILLVVAAHLVSSLAAAMLVVVLAVAAFEASGPAGVAILTIVELLPTLAVIPIAARATTAEARRRTLLASQLLGAVGACALGLALLAGTGTLVVYVLAAASAASTITAWAMTLAWLPALAVSPAQLVASTAALMTDISWSPGTRSPGCVGVPCSDRSPWHSWSSSPRERHRRSSATAPPSSVRARWGTPSTS